MHTAGDVSGCFQFHPTMNAKSFWVIALLLLASCAFAQTPARSPEYCPIPPVDSTLVRGEAAHDNLWPGFGTGSRRQSDMASARLYRTLDLVGVGLTSVGAIGVTATALTRGVMNLSHFDGRTNVPYFIFGGLAAAGVATIVTSRIYAVRTAREYDLMLFPTSMPGGGVGVGVNLQF